MKIIPFEEEYLNEFAQQIVEDFKPWEFETARKYLGEFLTGHEKYCWMAVDDNGENMGAAFCFTSPYVNGTYLFLDYLLVKEKFRGKGAAKALFERLKEITKDEKFTGMVIFADMTKEFPIGWYEKLGFKRTGWVEMELLTKDM